MEQLIFACARELFARWRVIVNAHESTSTGRNGDPGHPTNPH